MILRSNITHTHNKIFTLLEDLQM